MPVELKLRTPERFSWGSTTAAAGSDAEPRVHAAVARRRVLASAWSAGTLVAGKHGEEFRLLVQLAWTSFHSKRPLWRARGPWLQKLHLLVYPMVGWSTGSRHWTSVELRQLRSVQMRMTRHILRLWLKHGWKRGQPMRIAQTDEQSSSGRKPRFPRRRGPCLAHIGDRWCVAATES